jgi:hypothetical protein
MYADSTRIIGQERQRREVLADDDRDSRTGEVDSRHQRARLPLLGDDPERQDHRDDHDDAASSPEELLEHLAGQRALVAERLERDAHGEQRDAGDDPAR